jgi:hypothetical protein
MVLAHEHQLPSPVTRAVNPQTQPLQYHHSVTIAVNIPITRLIAFIAMIPRLTIQYPPQLHPAQTSPAQRPSRTHARDTQLPPARVPSTPAKTINLPKDSPRACTLRRSIRLSLFAKPYPLHTPWYGDIRSQPAGSVSHVLVRHQFNSLSSRILREIRILGLP